jgi:hypothetical protein
LDHSERADRVTAGQRHIKSDKIGFQPGYGGRSRRSIFSFTNDGKATTLF